MLVARVQHERRVQDAFHTRRKEHKVLNKDFNKNSNRRQISLIKTPHIQIILNVAATFRVNVLCQIAPNWWRNGSTVPVANTTPSWESATRRTSARSARGVESAGRTKSPLLHVFLCGASRLGLLHNLQCKFCWCKCKIC